MQWAVSDVEDAMFAGLCVFPTDGQRWFKRRSASGTPLPAVAVGRSTVSAQDCFADDVQGFHRAFAGGRCSLERRGKRFANTGEAASTSALGSCKTPG